MSSKVACPSCGKGYRWKPDLAGRKVKCKCGEIFRMADASPDASEPPGTTELSDGYDLHDSHLGAHDVKAKAPQASASTATGGGHGKCPSCNQALKPGAVICINCGFNLKSGTKVTTAVGKPVTGDLPDSVAGKALTGGTSKIAKALEDREDDTPAPLWKDLFLPLGLIVLGIGMTFVKAMYFGDPDNQLTFVEAAIGVGIKVAISVPVLFVAMLIAVKVLDVAFGPLGQALFKLVAIALAPDAIGAIIEVAVGGGLVGWFAGFFISMVAFWILLSVLLDLDASEAMYMMMIVWGVQWVATFLTILVVGSLFA